MFYLNDSIFLSVLELTLGILSLVVVLYLTPVLGGIIICEIGHQNIPNLGELLDYLYWYLWGINGVLSGLIVLILAVENWDKLVTPLLVSSGLVGVLFVYFLIYKILIRLRVEFPIRRTLAICMALVSITPGVVINQMYSNVPWDDRPSWYEPLIWPMIIGLIISVIIEMSIRLKQARI